MCYKINIVFAVDPSNSLNTYINFWNTKKTFKFKFII